MKVSRAVGNKADGYGNKRQKELQKNKKSIFGGIIIMANVKVAINGFGRIGRLAFRQMFGAEG